MRADGLHVVETGEGVPVVLLHGLTATHRYVVMGSSLLERGGHRVLTYDARGHGRSQPADADAGYGYPALTADLLAVMDAAGIDRAVLAGASMGAHTAAQAAIEHPARVAGIVAITPAFDPSAPASAASLQRWDALSAGLREGGVEGFLAAYGTPDVPAAWQERLIDVMRQRLDQHEHPAAVADALHATPRSRPFASWDDLSAIKIPAVVVADRDEADPGHPLAVGEAWAQAIPGARLVVEQPGQSPIAWQGSQLSKVIADVARDAG